MSETAFQKLNKYRFKVKKDEGSRVASQVLWMLDRFDSALVTILIGNNVVNVALSVVFTSLFLKAIPNLEAGVSSLIASVVLTIIVYIVAETLPKQIAGKIPNRIASLTVFPLTFFYFLLYPLNLIFKGISWLTKKIFKTKEKPDFTEEDFTSVVEKNEKHGLLEENESDLIQASFDFADTSVQDVLTSKDKMFEINMAGLTSQSLIDQICNTTYSRIPLYFGEKDKVVGILIVKKFLAAYISNPKVNLTDFVEKPYIVSPKATMEDLIEGFKEHHTQVALVKKNGQLIGMISMEDVLEELVGPINEKIALPRGIHQ
jgi:CBS domain containing-hemolysin-like protein